MVLETTGPLRVFINGRPFDVRRCFVRRATATTREDPGVADSATRWPGPGGFQPMAAAQVETGSGLDRAMALWDDSR